VTRADPLLLVTAVTDLKHELATAIGVALARFQDRTGLTPSALHVRLIETTTMADPIREHAVGGIDVEFRL
jgi:hypothetical protein